MEGNGFAVINVKVTLGVRCTGGDIETESWFVEGGRTGGGEVYVSCTGYNANSRAK